MLPLTDHNPRRTTPVINYLLVAINVLMFLWELQLGPALERALYSVAFIPARFWIAGNLVPDLITATISMFLHGGLMHIGSNLLYLWIFGDNIEDRLGHFRYLLFYLLCGYGATLAHALAAPSSTVPAIGASGAIAGVLGAYLILFPRAQITTLIPIFFFITVREIPAIILLGFWFILQFFSGFGSLGAADNAGGVAYWAHIGGFLLGMIAIFIFGGATRRPPPPPARPWWA